MYAPPPVLLSRAQTDEAKAYYESKSAAPRSGGNSGVGRSGSIKSSSTGRSMGLFARMNKIRVSSPIARSHAREADGMMRGRQGRGEARDAAKTEHPPSFGEWPRKAPAPPIRASRSSNESAAFPQRDGSHPPITPKRVLWQEAKSKLTIFNNIGTILDDKSPNGLSRASTAPAVMVQGSATEQSTLMAVKRSTTTGASPAETSQNEALGARIGDSTGSKRSSAASSLESVLPDDYDMGDGTISTQRPWDCTARAHIHDKCGPLPPPPRITSKDLPSTPNSTMSTPTETYHGNRSNQTSVKTDNAIASLTSGDLAIIPETVLTSEDSLLPSSTVTRIISAEDPSSR